MTTLPSFAEFESKARAAGFDEVLERQWAPDTVIATHSQSFDVDALVARGEMWLTCGGRPRHLKPGDRFTPAGLGRRDGVLTRGRQETTW